MKTNEIAEEIERAAKRATPVGWGEQIWTGSEDGEWVAVGPRHFPIGEDAEDNTPETEAAKAAMRDAIHVASCSPDRILALIASWKRMREALEECHYHSSCQACRDNQPLIESALKDE